LDEILPYPPLPAFRAIPQDRPFPIFAAVADSHLLGLKAPFGPFPRARLVMPAHMLQ